MSNVPIIAWDILKKYFLITVIDCSKLRKLQCDGKVLEL
jgi:hypothetical protein